LCYPLLMLTTRLPRLAALLAACLAACACGGPPSQDNASANAANTAQQQAVPELPIPAPAEILGREQLLVAAQHAASDFAVGLDDAQRQEELAGRKFEFRVRFGCDGPSQDPAGALDWSLSKDSGALKVRATPTLSTKDPPVKAIAGEAFEAVEGFWIREPWLLTAACPRAATQPEERPQQDDQPADVPQTVGIAQFFTAGGARTVRRSGRAYEATTKLDEGDQPSGGFDLVLSGRLVALPDGRVIACTAAANRRPNCVISVEFGKVSIERADTHGQLAQWGPS
jgi:hypothetical protein